MKFEYAPLQDEDFHIPDFSIFSNVKDSGRIALLFFPEKSSKSNP
jgi:hypothetical protein